MTNRRLSATKEPILTKPFVFEKLAETLVALLRGEPVGAAAEWP